MHKGIIVRKSVSADDWKDQAAKITEKEEIVIEKVIKLGEAEFDIISKNFLTDSEYAKEYTEQMYTENGVWHMIAFQCQSRNYIICADCEGYDYLRYTSVITIEEFEKPYLNRCYCPKCGEKESCIHCEAYRRMPIEVGGLGLCPKLKKGTDPRRNL
jgi:hypothetical protein